jgi:hypothetical protein
MTGVLKQSRSERQINRGGNLQRPRITLDDAHLPTAALNEPGIIGGRHPTGVSALKHFTHETLRGLYGAKTLTLRSLQNTTLGVDHLDSVCYRQAWDNGRVATSYRTDDPCKQLGRRKAPGNIVHQHDAVVTA